MIYKIKRDIGIWAFSLCGIRIIKLEKDFEKNWWNISVLGVRLARLVETRGGDKTFYMLGIRLVRLKKKVDQVSILRERVRILESAINITALPPAQGWRRDIQLANLSIMLEIDRVCRKNGITYWLNAGSLLGAVRHHGCIPWDEDIDIGMLRHDMERFLGIFEQECKEGFYIQPHSEERFSLIKIKHRSTPHCFIDIFAYDCYYTHIESVDERVKLTKWFREQQYRFPRTGSREEKLNFYFHWRDNVLLKGNTPDINQRPDIYLGGEFLSFWERNIFIEYDTLFPTKTISYEGYELSIPNKPDVYLTYYYGDYMRFPGSVAGGHMIIEDISIADMLCIKKLAAQHTAREQ